MKCFVFLFVIEVYWIVIVIYSIYYCRGSKIIITLWDKFTEAINKDTCYDEFKPPIVIVTSTIVKTYR